MLYLDDPQTEFIFEAAAFIDRIRKGCELYIIQSFEARQDTFTIMEIECEELLLFSEKHFFNNLDEISLIIKEILEEINKLKVLNELSEKGNCTVCNTPLIMYDTLVIEFGWKTMCEKCPSNLYKLLYYLEMPTGVIAI